MATKFFQTNELVDSFFLWLLKSSGYLNSAFQHIDPKYSPFIYFLPDVGLWLLKGDFKLTYQAS